MEGGSSPFSNWGGKGGGLMFNFDCCMEFMFEIFVGLFNEPLDLPVSKVMTVKTVI